MPTFWKGSLMTSIKPPSFPTPSDVSAPTGRTESPSGAAAGRSEGPSGSSFKQALDQASQVPGAGQAGAHTVESSAYASETSSVSHASHAGHADPVAGLIRDVEAGRLSMDQAVDRLLTQTLAQADKQLDVAQRAELSGLLREALLNDPTLLALRATHD
jgi:hypothetical protein